MDWTKLFGIIVQLAIFSMFVSAIIEVIKGISAIGLWGVVTGLVKYLWKNDPMAGEAFPVINFATSMLCSWAFNVTIMASVFSGVLTIQSAPDAWQVLFAKWIDYFGTASLIYMGSDQLFKRVLNVEKQATAFMEQTKVETKSVETKTVES